MIMKLLPIVPYVYYRGAVALRRNVGGFIPGPHGGRERIVRHRGTYQVGVTSERSGSVLRQRASASAAADLPTAAIVLLGWFLTVRR
jgi:hypothetical protein